MGDPTTGSISRASAVTLRGKRGAQGIVRLGGLVEIVLGAAQSTTFSRGRTSVTSHTTAMTKSAITRLTVATCP